MCVHSRTSISRRRLVCIRTARCACSRRCWCVYYLYFCFFLGSTQQQTANGNQKLSLMAGAACCVFRLSVPSVLESCTLFRHLYQWPSTRQHTLSRCRREGFETRDTHTSSYIILHTHGVKGGAGLPCGRDGCRRTGENFQPLPKSQSGQQPYRV